MKQVFSLFLALVALHLTSCAQRYDTRTVLKHIKSIKITESPEARTAIVKSTFTNVEKNKQFEEKGPYFQNISLYPISLSKEGSEIVITDTVGLLTEDTDVEIVPSEGGVNVIIDVNVQTGQYYCQVFQNGKVNIERGTIGVHLNKNNLSTLHTYSASNHFASAVSSTLIVIYQRAANGSVSVVRQYSTNGTEICVYKEQGSLVVATRP